MLELAHFRQGGEAYTMIEQARAGAPLFIFALWKQTLCMRCRVES